MPRAKPQSIQSVLHSIPQPISWSMREKEVLTDNLFLDIDNPRHKKQCNEVLSVLASRLESHLVWETHQIEYPGPANRAKEIEKAIPIVSNAFDIVSRLSYAACQDIKNALTVREYNADRIATFPIKAEIVDIHRLQANAMNTLAQLLACMKTAKANYPRENRGRKRSLLRGLREIIAGIFDKYYKGPKCDHKRSQKKFITASLKYLSIRKDDQNKLRSNSQATAPSRK